MSRYKVKSTLAEMESSQLSAFVRRRRADIEHIFVNDLPMLDVRSEIEFSKGAFPTAENYPILNSDERKQVGICYKQRGQAAAIALGAELVNDSVKLARVARWVHFAETHKTGRLYCFRGGLRSQISQQWMRDEGIDYPLVPGGYKAMRQFLIEEIELAAATSSMIIISGKTGSGKTDLIRRFSNSTDLESLSHHKGSAFGRGIRPQPTQINYENSLAIRLLKLRKRYPATTLMLEDEGRHLGSLNIPVNFYGAMVKSPIVVVEPSLQQRIANVLKDYVEQSFLDYITVYGDEGPDKFAHHLTHSLQRISRRLGGERYQLIAGQLKSAIPSYCAHRDIAGFEPIVKCLLKDYYDPMYEYQLSKKADYIIFRGSYDEVFDYLTTSNMVEENNIEKHEFS